MNKPLTAGRTVYAGNDSAPASASAPGALTGKGEIPYPNAMGQGSGGEIHPGQLQECVGGSNSSKHTPILTWTH